jgi:16S rRNA (cytosine967-C5)-methyltransferase
MTQADTRTPLWKQLQATAEVVQAVQRGVSGTAAMEDVPGVLRPAVQALTFQVLRNLGRAQALRKQLAAKMPSAPVDALLCVALALTWDPENSPYDDFTLVNQAVEAAKRNRSTQRQANFVNACLRRFLRERPALVAYSSSDEVAVWNHPQWWINRVRKEHPAQWQEMLRAANTHAPMTLRVNVQQIAAVEYVGKLKDHEVPVADARDSAVVLGRPTAVHLIPGFQEGMVSVQDYAAQIAAPLLLAGLVNRKGLRVLDACAAPGGKTGHLLEMGVLNVTALEIDAQRCLRIEENLSRLGLRATVLNADAAKPDQWWDGVPFDAILLDAPCTASGIVRRHPDVRWLRREDDIGKLAALQQTLMQVLWKLLKPGGRMLYCTCSLFLAEGGQQVQTFLANNTDAAMLPSPGHLLPIIRVNEDCVLDNPLPDHDGFFYALLEKKLA